MHFLGCLFLLLIIVVVFIPALLVSALGGVYNSIMELFTGKRPSSAAGSHTSSGNGRAQQSGSGSRSTSHSGASHGGKRKIIPDGEGEYVDFEEVKE